MNLKIGGNNVGKIMYNGQEFGNQKLEPGTILYVSSPGIYYLKDAHLFSTTNNWSNIDGINISVSTDDINSSLFGVNISGDDFKNLDVDKKYRMDVYTVTVSRSIVDGEYRLNFSGYNVGYDTWAIVIKAI